MTFCRLCGREAPDDSRFCPGCGQPIGDVEPPASSGSARARSYRRLREAESGAVDPKALPSCPRCSSTHVQLTKRGWSWVSGFIGSGADLVVCLKCGHRFKPGQGGDRPRPRGGPARFRAVLLLPVLLLAACGGEPRLTLDQRAALVSVARAVRAGLKPSEALSAPEVIAVRDIPRSLYDASAGSFLERADHFGFVHGLVLRTEEVRLRRAVDRGDTEPPARDENHHKVVEAYAEAVERGEVMRASRITFSGYREP